MAARIDWVQADVRGWAPPSRRGSTWSPRSSCTCRPEPRAPLFARLADAVAPGGTLLIVGHDPGDLATGHRWGAADMMYAAADLAPLLDPAVWDVEVLRGPAPEVPAHDGPHEGRHGGDVTVVRDAVLAPRRR